MIEASVVLEQVACPKCSSGESSVIAVGNDHLHGIAGDYRACECNACGLWFLNPRPTAASLPALYPDDYLPHAEPVAAPVSKTLRRYLADELGYAHLTGESRLSPLERRRSRWQAGVTLVPQFVENGALLEIGAASGSRLLTLRELGWRNLHGIEPSQAAAAKARDLGFDVRCGTVEATLDDFPDESFDVVIASMVLEHLSDPFAVIANIARKLRPGGEFLFSTITRDALDMRLFGSFWAGFDFPRHFVFLRDSDLDDMLRDRFVTFAHHHHAAPQDFVRSATWRQAEGRWFDRALLRFAQSRFRRGAVVALAWAGLTCRVSYRCRRSG